MENITQSFAFKNAVKIALELEPGTSRRARSEDGTPSNYSGYKTHDGTLVVYADEWEDMPDADLKLNNLKPEPLPAVAIRYDRKGRMRVQGKIFTI